MKIMPSEYNFSITCFKSEFIPSIRCFPVNVYITKQTSLRKWLRYDEMVLNTSIMIDTWYMCTVLLNFKCKSV